MLNQLFWIVPVCAIVALFFAFLFFKGMMKESEGNIMWPEISPIAEQAGIDATKEQFRIFNTQPLNK